MLGSLETAMPTYDYEACDASRSCPRCRDGFECLQPVAAPRLTVCPDCGGPVRRRLSAPAIGRSRASLDQRAKQAGFTKLKKIGAGEYEKQY